MFLREKLAITDIENKEQSSIQLSYQVTTIVIMVPSPHLQARRLYILLPVFHPHSASSYHATVLYIEIFLSKKGDK